MFRQHIVSCNCQLFSPQHYEIKDYRSPPPHTNRNDTKSKRSLKSQSHSRNRIINQQSKLIRNSEKHESQNDRNIKIFLVPSRQTSNLTAQSDYQFKAMPAPLTKISLLNSKNDRRQTNQVTHKQNFPIPKGCPIRSIKYQTRLPSPQANQNIDILRDITSNSNMAQNNCFIRMSESISPVYYQKYPKYRQYSAETTLAGSIVPISNQNIHVQKGPSRIPHYFQNHTQGHITVINKNSMCEEKTKLRPGTHANFVKLSRLSEMINDKQETQSVYQGQKTHEQGGVEFSRVLISCKKLMQQQNGVLQQTQRTKLFDYYPQPSKRSSHSSTFQKIHLLPSNLR